MSATIVEVFLEGAQVVEVTNGSSQIVEVFEGTPGPPGPTGAAARSFTYVMPVAQTTATINHDLGYDPVAVQVFDEDDVLCDGYSVVFTSHGSQVRIGFDIPIKATVRLL